jgi:LysM repeat protein
LFLSNAAYGQAEQERIDAYIKVYKDLAISEMLRSGVPASITLAQGILETGGGQSDLASLAYNHFGIKCKSEWTGETISHTDDLKDECFRKYSCVADSYKDHSDFLRTRPGYAFLFKLDPTDFEGWAKGLKRAGYATNPAYAQKLIKLIIENNLQEYTLLALNSRNANEEMLADIKGEMILNEVIAVKPAAMHISADKTKKTIYPVNSVFKINDLKVIYADAGTSLLGLANNYNISFKKLLEYNELADESDILNSAQLIYLEKKSKKGSKDIHIVEPNETLRDISQKEGIQLAVIREYNGLQKGMEPAQGEKIYLKYPAPTSPRLTIAVHYSTASSM